jgi:hypothetical protein
VWQFSRDGETWVDLKDTRTVNEQRAFRLHRLQQVVEARWFRLRIDAAMNPATGPILREVEFYPETDSPVSFPDWVLSVNITDRPWDCLHRECSHAGSRTAGRWSICPEGGLSWPHTDLMARPRTSS